jgi:hypothetical protein
MIDGRSTATAPPEHLCGFLGELAFFAGRASALADLGVANMLSSPESGTVADGLEECVRLHWLLEPLLEAATQEAADRLQALVEGAREALECEPDELLGVFCPLLLDELGFLELAGQPDRDAVGEHKRRLRGAWAAVVAKVEQAERRREGGSACRH